MRNNINNEQVCLYGCDKKIKNQVAGEDTVAGVNEYIKIRATVIVTAAVVNKNQKRLLIRQQ